jgi:formylglycine-generating enzyme required for sulfatase activity
MTRRIQLSEIYASSLSLLLGCVFACHCNAADAVAPLPLTLDTSVGIADSKPESGPSVQVGDKYMVPYTVVMPDDQTTFEMIPIPGGTVTLGSPETEAGRNDDEGPRATVEIPPFWMAKTEITWAEYRQFMQCYNVFKKMNSQGIRKVTDENRIHAVTVPTPLYEPDHTFEYGNEPQQPAVTMTQYSAKQYSKWLAGMYAQQFRLPTEAEWEYACRAGTTTAYSFGDSAENLDEYAYLASNSPDGAGLVGTKKPNAFGLHDMHGNVWEWVIDSYTEDGYASLGDETKSWWEGVQWAVDQYPRTVRGGGWQDEPESLRSAARMGSQDEDWKDEDPNIPLSPWWFTSDPAREVGFRLVRSFKPLEDQQMTRFWDIDDEMTEIAVEARLIEGRGVLGLINPELKSELQ